jgi:hypothetical protein
MEEINMDELIVELTNYVVEIYDSANSEQIKNELINTKMLDILRRLGYSDSLSQIIITNAQQPASLITIYNNLYGMFNNHQDVRGSIENRIETILDNFTLLKLSIRNEPEKTLEEKIRRYFRNAQINDTNLDRMIPIISNIILRNPDTFTKLSIHDVIKFAKYHKHGDLVQIHNIFYRMLGLLDYTIHPIVDETELYYVLNEYYAAKECSTQVFDNTYNKIISKLEQHWTDARENHRSITDNWNIIARDIEDIILKYRIKRLLDISENSLENNTDHVNEFCDYHGISFNYFHEIARIMFKLKIKEFHKENNNFTESSVRDFLSNNIALSRHRFDEIINYMNLEIYPDPLLDPETGESLGREGSVLPNCPICWNILNINIEGSSDKYRIEWLACGGLIHNVCLINFMTENNSSTCPICGESV